MREKENKAAPHVLNQEGNGVLRCYNMFPPMFGTIDNMTAYLPTIQKMGFNTVWINPIQLASSASLVKPNKLTGISERIGYSLYAIKDFDLIDPRFSVVKLDQYGMPQFSLEQRGILMSMPDSDLQKLFKIHSKRRLKELLGTNIAAILKRHDLLISKYEQLKADLLQIKIEGTLREQRVLKSQHKKEEADFDQSIAYLTHLRQKEIDGILLKLKMVIVYFDRRAIQQFTKEATRLGLTPIFDLVLNHVGKDAALCSQYPEWFELDPSFPDTNRFRYSYQGGKFLQEIFETVWEPYIALYMGLGFKGARIDCVRKLPQELRTMAYSAIRSRMEFENPIILEELLFSNEEVTTLTNRLGAAGATHVTCSAFYEKREWHGGMPSHIRIEQEAKAKLVSEGSINFTGNHDHSSAAYNVLLDMARDRLANHEHYNFIVSTYKRKHGQEGKLSAAAELRFMFSFVSDIIAEINSNPESETSKQFLKLLLDKFSVNMFAGSAGYYMLSGDEAALELPSVIELRANRLPIFPEMCHPALINPSLETIECLRMLAEALLNKSPESEEIYRIAGNADNDSEKRILAPYIEQIKYLINGKDPSTLNQFELLMIEEMRRAGLDFKPNQDFVLIPRTAQNQRGSFGELFAKKLQQFIADNNRILARLPKPTPTTHSDMFILNDYINVTVRYADAGFAGPAHIIVNNIDPERTFSIGLKELKDIATWVQRRYFPNEDMCSPSQDFHDAWYSIMGGESNRELPVIHMNKGLVIDSAIRKQVVVGSQITHETKTYTMRSLTNTLFKRKKSLPVEQDDNTLTKDDGSSHGHKQSKEICKAF